jgi:hypothetical protein
MTIKSNSDKRKNVKKVLAITLGSIGAVAILVVAACLLWWYGFFLPRWIKWEKEEAAFEALNVTLKGRKVIIRDNNTVLWETQADWFVQDMLVKDIDRDGADELILLVWKHGSYGDRMPFWEEKNDKELHQHIFIYKYDPKKENKVRPLWMSSQILYEIEYISSGKDSFLDVTDHEGTTRTWIWQDFGLKLVR